MSDFDIELNDAIEAASSRVGPSWPLYSFVTSNPLSGFEELPFRDAVQRARGIIGGRGYPSAYQFRQAYEQDRIDPAILRDELEDRGLEEEPEELLTELERSERNQTNGTGLSDQDRSLNQILEKWLSSFLDEGQARWPMPNREQGFYNAWYRLAPHDHHIANAADIEQIPPNKYNAIRSVLDEVPKDDWVRVLTYHLTALPGWVGYIKQRHRRRGDEWAENYPIDLIDYAAVRLVLADQLGATVVPEEGVLAPQRNQHDPVRDALLEAWEQSYRSRLYDRLDLEQADSTGTGERPDAQMIFCIDTRSEIIRRHIETAGDYETHGFGGFFGLPIQHRRYEEDVVRNACPPIVEPDHVIQDVGRPDRDARLRRFHSVEDLKHATKQGLKNIKDNLASAFSYVEFTGLFYGLEILVKTLTPGWLRRLKNSIDERIPDYNEVTAPDIREDDGPSTSTRLSLEKQTDYAQQFFDTMGWQHFAPLVVITGHTSETSNNPFDSSLRCGACAGQSGTPNARVLARICNRDVVKERLRERGVTIPEDTVFLAARHNTTTDEITLFDDDVPDSHRDRVQQLKEDLSEARRGSAVERVSEMPGADPDKALSETERRAGDWAQMRPEWGLAGNASFFVGPNRLRDGVDLEGRAFLHTYDWETDPDGEALASIMGGPVVVCQWINHQYYFSTVDNGMWGSGTKITHNPVGNFGVLQGNGGDLMGGLPLQSLMRSDTEFQHDPLRITMVIHAPEQRVRSILEDQRLVADLVNNNWISMTVIDPTDANQIIELEEV